MSFILDALRKSEHERQRATVPGLSQVPLAVPRAEMPRWAIAVIGVLAAAVLALGVAWWQSARPPETQASASTIERPVELPPPMPTTHSALVQAPSAQPAAAEPTPASAPPSAPDAISPSGAFALERAAASSVAAGGEAARDPEAVDTATAEVSASPELPADVATLPSAAALAAEGVALPPLRLELHAYSPDRQSRFVFINGRKYVEGERLVEGPQLLSIAPTGAVLAHAGRRFLLVQE